MLSVVLGVGALTGPSAASASGAGWMGPPVTRRASFTRSWTPMSGSITWDRRRPLDSFASGGTGCLKKVSRVASVKAPHWRSDDVPGQQYGVGRSRQP